MIVAWKDSWWRHTIRGLRYTEADPEVSRLSIAHQTLGKRRWDEGIQKLVMTEARGEMPWQMITEKLVLWNSLDI